MSSKADDFENILHVFLWYFGKNDFYQDKIKPVLTYIDPQLISSIAALTVGGLAVKYWLFPFLNQRAKRDDYRSAIEQAQERRDDELVCLRRTLKELMNDDEVQKIIQLIPDGPLSIKKKLKDGSVRPTQVVAAYQYYMLNAQEKTNCLTNVLDDAMEQAKALEKEYLGKDKPPLYGVVMSVKDMFAIKGRDSTVGLAKYLNQPLQRDCVIVQALKKNGAIIIGKTGCPQTLISYGSGNPIYGTVNNPNSRARCAGGSSSGEGALLAMNGAMAGVGSDLGGSVRIPSHFCGICGLRPMNGRLSANGALECIAGYRGIESTYGFLARDVEMLAECYAAMLGPTMFELDPEVPPVPWRCEIYEAESPLCIGYFVDDGYFTPTPGVKRAVQMTIDGLRRCGHQLIPFEVPNSWEMMADYLRLLLQDNGVQLLEQLENEDIDICLKPTASLVASINSNELVRLKSLIDVFSSRLGYHSIKSILDIQCPVDVMKTFARRDIYRKKFLSMWKEKRLDVIVCPATGTPALPPDIPPKLLYALSYTMRFNFLDMPAGIVPVTLENEADQRDLKNYREDDEVYVLTKKAVKGALGMPIGVQCAGLPFQEEMVLRVMRDIQKTAGRDMFMRPPLLETM